MLLPPVVSPTGTLVRFTSLPGSTHRLQRASALGESWLTLTHLTVPTHGVAEFTDPSPAQSDVFYLTVVP